MAENRGAAPAEGSYPLSTGPRKSGRAVRANSFVKHEENPPLELGWRSLLYSAGTCIVAAVLFYLADYYLKSKKLEYLAHIAQHLSIAFTVALVSIVALEYNAKKRANEEFGYYRRRVSEDVFGAVLGRIVPEAIVREVKEMLRIPVIKTDCEYIITFLQSYPGMPQGYCVLRRDLSFVVTNLLEEPTEFPVRSYYTSDEDSASEAWLGRPFHLELAVNKEPVNIPEHTSSAGGKGFRLDYQVRLGPHESAHIFLRGEEPVRIEAGRSSYTQSTPVESLKVSIRNNYAQAIGSVHVQMYHPAWAYTEYDPNLEHYTLDRAFLPGQGFEVQWKTLSSAAVDLDKRDG